MMQAEKRKGSVLLQTLVMCVVLSFIAVSITRWVFARYSSAARNYNDSSINGAQFKVVNHDFSYASIQNSSSNCLTNVGNGTTAEGARYSVSCTSSNNVSKYTYTIVVD